MYIGIVTPAPVGSRSGNRVTATRWARVIRGLGHRVLITESYQGQNFDLLIALHAIHSKDSIRTFNAKYPDKPLIVALAGTDLYASAKKQSVVKRSLKMATRIVVLQKQALEELRPSARARAVVIYQSVSQPVVRRELEKTDFKVSVIGHLRPVKDPFRAAMASRLLPEQSKIRVIHAGRAMDLREARVAETEMEKNPRYKWLGEVTPAGVRRVLAKSNLFVLSSKGEGGANVLGEAITAGVPVITSRISGSLGILGEDYPGYFEFGDTRGLARLMLRCETDSRFLRELTRRCASLKKLFDPARETAAWKKLLKQVEGRG
jgi:putative glycosyltransferase (TIGR04348 family)